VVLLDEGESILGHLAARSGYSGKEVATRLRDQLLSQSGLTIHDTSTVATGYGRITYPADREVSEITCQARGISHLFPEARTIIDIGGQDSKVIRLAADGKVADFAMNDKCAAGTGRFLEVMATALEVELVQIGELVLSSKQPKKISSFCTVFAESEVISQVASGASKPDILAGVCDSVATRVVSMVRRIGLEPTLIFTGGVALNEGLARAISKQLGYSLSIPKEPVITAALGAALIAKDLYSR